MALPTTGKTCKHLLELLGAIATLQSAGYALSFVRASRPGRSRRAVCKEGE